jgi:hypothetical protein
MQFVHQNSSIGIPIHSNNQYATIFINVCGFTLTFSRLDTSLVQRIYYCIDLYVITGMSESEAKRQRIPHRVAHVGYDVLSRGIINRPWYAEQYLNHPSVEDMTGPASRSASMDIVFDYLNYLMVFFQLINYINCIISPLFICSTFLKQEPSTRCQCIQA